VKQVFGKDNKKINLIKSELAYFEHRQEHTEAKRGVEGYRSTNEEFCTSLNSIRRISSLKRQINFKGIRQSQHFYLCIDKEEQILYISDPEVRTIQYLFKTD
jgi:hypothetical protein